MLYSPPSTVTDTELVTFAMLASKYDRQMLSEFFIYSEDIIPSPAYLTDQKSRKLPSNTLEKQLFRMIASHYELCQIAECLVLFRLEHSRR